MINTLDNIDKKAILDKILQSHAFANSQVYKDLLRYLVEASINNVTPKEYTIATEVFQKGPGFDPSQDTIVRVYMYNLRRKLAQYYSDEGMDEQVRIDVPKGHYSIEFSLYQKPKKSASLNRHIWIIPLIVLFLSNIFFIYKYSVTKSLPGRSGVHHDDLVWSSFFSNNAPKQIVLGDHFFFLKDSGSREKRTIMRRDDINSVNDLDAYKAESVERRNYKLLEYPMFPRNSVWPCADIIKLFMNNHLDFELNFSSNVTAQDIKNYNLLFIGSFHTLAVFDQTFRNSASQYLVYPNVLSYYDEINDSLITLPEEGDPLSHHVDYGIVRKIPGPNKNIVFIFTSFHETGTIGIVKYFTNKESLEKLEELFIRRFGHVPLYFEIIFKASGYNRTVYSTEIIYIKEIDPDTTFW